MKRLYGRMIAPICGWAKPIADKKKRERRNDRALGLIVCNAIFLAIVLICFQCDVQGTLKDAPKHLQWYFAGGEVVIIAAYAVNAWMTRTFVAKLFRGLGRQQEVPEVPSGYSVPIEAFGIMNAFAVGFITYYTGGPSNSPYAQVLVAMLLIAEQTRTIKEPDQEERLSRVLTTPFKEFRTFLLITFLFYLLLGTLQWQFPIPVKTAPAGVSIGITIVIFLVGTITTYVSASSRSRKAVEAEVAAEHTEETSH